MLVGDVPDELLDDVLERDHAGGAAVLVDDDGHLQAQLAQLDQQRAQVHGLGHARRLDHQGGRGHVGPALVRHADRAAQVHQPDDVVARVADDGEPRVPGAAGQVDDVGRRLLPAHDDEPQPVGHDVDGGELGELDRVGEQRRGRLVERADLRRAPHQRGELLRRAAAGQLLARLDAERCAAARSRCR